MGVRYIELSNSNPYPSNFRKLSRASECCLLLGIILLAGLILLNLLPYEKSKCSRGGSTIPSSKLEYRGVVESMDGIGFTFQKNPQITLDPRFNDFLSLPNCSDLQANSQPSIDIDAVMKEFKECITAHIASFKENIGLIEHSWEANTTICEEKLNLGNMKIDEFKNQHESKWAVMPKCMEDHIMVTLGVGHEVSAETQLNRTLPNIKFYGADPIIEPNIQLFSELGRFFPFAIGRQSGTDNFRVLPNQNQKTREYVYQDVTTIEVVYVLKEIMKLSWIDFLWIDTEGAEIQFLDYFYKGGKFDENGITICQFNMELHPHYVKDGPQKFYEFVDQLAKDGTYLFMKARTTGVGVFRMYFLNMRNPECLKKYVL